MPSTRRGALRSFVSVLTLSLAGCAGDGGDGTARTSASGTTRFSATTTERVAETRTRQTTETPRPTATPSPTPRAPDALAVEEREAASYQRPGEDEAADSLPKTFFVLSVGERSQVESDRRQPHEIWVSNVSDSQRDTTLRLSNARGTVFERTVTFDANSRAVVVLQVPSAYELTVAVAGGSDVTETVEIPFSRFDCNSSATIIEFDGNGSIDVTEMTTLVGCRIPTPGETPEGTPFPTSSSD